MKLFSSCKLTVERARERLRDGCAPHAGGGESLSRSGPALPDHATLGTLRKIVAANRRLVVRFEDREIGNG